MKSADANKKSFEMASSSDYSTTSLTTSKPSTSILCQTYKRLKNSTDNIQLISINGDFNEEAKEQAYQIIIGISGLFSLASLLCLCLVIPSMYNYVDTMGTFSKQDFAYCESSTIGIEAKMGPIVRNILEKSNRTKRSEDQSQYGHYNPTLLHPNAPVFQECPACCVPGERGPNGDSGLPGIPGSPGPDGAPGRPGTTPNASCIPERIFEPPPCLPCPQGPRGVPGHPGFPGDPGDSGIPGRPGMDGQPGPPGEDGPQGPDGIAGEPGPVGDKGVTPEAHIIPGPPGDAGETGPWGPPGHPGTPGEDGYPGSPGEKGYPGAPGPPGVSGAAGAQGPPGEPGPIGTPGTCVCQDTEVVMTDTRQTIPAASQPVVHEVNNQGGYDLPSIVTPAQKSSGYYNRA